MAEIEGPGFRELVKCEMDGEYKIAQGWTASTVVCESECDGADLYETVCDNGIFVRGALIEANSADCEYVPPNHCEGAVCEIFFKTIGGGLRFIFADDGTLSATIRVFNIGLEQIEKVYVVFTINDVEIERYDIYNFNPDTLHDRSFTKIQVPIGSLSLAANVYCNGILLDNISASINTPDPCEGVVCSPECVGNDLYNTVCDNGICVSGALIEANSADCGYDPDEDITDILMNNKELVILGAIAGIIIIKSI